MTEQWKPVVGYEGSYEVSAHGNVRSLDRWRRNRQSLYLVKGRPVTQHELHFGHYCVYLYQLGVKRHKRWLTHRLVLTAFTGPCPDGHEGCHMDGDPQITDSATCTGARTPRTCRTVFATDGTTAASRQSRPAASGTTSSHLRTHTSREMDGECAALVSTTGFAATAARVDWAPGRRRPHDVWDELVGTLRCVSKGEALQF